MSNYNLHDPLQSAYKCQHSTETALQKIHNDIIGSLDANKCTVLASLDLSAAFDTVEHSIFLQRLCYLFGIDGTALQWFKSYLSDRNYKISINNALSNNHKLKCGVPQGSVLGARFYTIYTHPLSYIINNHKLQYHSYADDTQIYLTCDNTDTSIKESIVRLQINFHLVSNSQSYVTGKIIRV